MSEFFTVNTSDGVCIEAKLWRSDKSISVNLPMILFVHQLGKLGGSSNLMQGMARKMSSKGFDSITFDLRGIGKSTGYSTWTCRSELNDVKSMIDYISISTKKDIILVGSSAGAPLAGAVLDYSPRIKGGLMIGYVWGFWASILFGWAYEPLQKCCKPKLFVIGDRDEFTSVAQYQTRMAVLQGHVNIPKIIEGKNHFEIESPVYDDQVTTWLDEFIYEHIINKECNNKNIK